MPRPILVLLFITAWAQAGVRVTPGQSTLQAGATWAFAADLDGAQPPGGWRWSVPEGGGEIDERTGLYRAPEGAAGARVRAELRSGPAVAGEATVLVLPLPAEVGGLVSAALGEPPVGSRLPFLDPETGQRPVPEPRIIPSEDHVTRLEPWLAGCGIPFPFTQRTTMPVDGLRLTYREGSDLVRRDLESGVPMEVVFRGPVASVTVEAMLRSRMEPGKWRSTIHQHEVDLRGVLPCCGNAVAPGGHQDGQGQAARFQRPFGLVHLFQPDGPNRSRPVLLVTDPVSHVLRTMLPGGAVATLCGQPGQPGHRDSPTVMAKMGGLFRDTPPGPPLFHGPTHAAQLRPGTRCRTAVVADSGNHVIRTVSLDGKVATLAGTPGRAGYRDSGFAQLAAFNDPQGLASDAEGRVYVADRGNRVIRVIHPDGAVTTLAGCPGEAGSSDLPARFTDLKGLCMHPRLGILYVLDGHALRLVHLPGGQVATWLGVVDAPDFRDLAEDEHRLQPCLNDPTGIACTKDGLAIADRGNHAVRIIGFDGRRLRTVAGDKAQGATRWGLVRDRLTGPLDERYGLLEGPLTVAAGPREGDLTTTSGRCLAGIRHALDVRLPLAIRAAAPVPETKVGETCVVTFAADDWSSFHYTADFLDPDGDRRVRVQGRVEAGGPGAVQGAFSQAGWGKVVIRGVTGQGVSAQAEVGVLIRP